MQILKEKKKNLKNKMELLKSFKKGYRAKLILRRVKRENNQNYWMN